MGGVPPAPNAIFGSWKARGSDRRQHQDAQHRHHHAGHRSGEEQLESRRRRPGPDGSRQRGVRRRGALERLADAGPLLPPAGPRARRRPEQGGRRLGRGLRAVLRGRQLRIRGAARRDRAAPAASPSARRGPPPASRAASARPPARRARCARTAAACRTRSERGDHLSVRVMTTSYGSSSPCSACSFGSFFPPLPSSLRAMPMNSGLPASPSSANCSSSPAPRLLTTFFAVLVAEHDDVDAGGRVDGAHDQSGFRRRDREPVAIFAAAEVAAHAAASPRGASRPPASRWVQAPSRAGADPTARSACRGPARSPSAACRRSRPRARRGMPRSARSPSAAAIRPSPARARRSSRCAGPAASNSSSTRSTPGIPSRRACRARGPLPAGTRK